MSDQMSWCRICIRGRLSFAATQCCFYIASRLLRRIRAILYLESSQILYFDLRELQRELHGTEEMGD